MIKNGKIKVFFQRITAIAVIAGLFGITWKILRYLVTDDEKSYTRITMHEFYEQDQIDVLFMGASHCYRGFDTAVTDQEFNCNTFNLGSSSQGLDVTYLLLQEAADRYDLKEVYLDLSYNIATIDLSDEKKLNNAYIITDYMKPSVRKTMFLLDKSSSETYANSFLIARRSWEKSYQLQYILDLWSRKHSEAYQNYEYPVNGVESYAGKGFVKEDTQISEGSLKDAFRKETFDLEAIHPKWIESLKKIIQFCDKNDIKLTLISIPVTSYRLQCYQNYDEYIDYINRIIEEMDTDVTYVDFNLLKEEYWVDTTLKYKDVSHLNAQGAAEFSKLFCDYVSGTYDWEALFYDSIKDKFAARGPEFYGILYDDQSKDDSSACRLIFNKGEGLIRRVTLLTDNQESVIKEWGVYEEFEIPADFRGMIRIEVAEPDEEDAAVSYYINF